MQCWKLILRISRKALISLVPFSKISIPAGFYEAFAVPSSVTTATIVLPVRVTCTPRKTQSGKGERASDHLLARNSTRAI